MRCGNDGFVTEAQAHDQGLESLHSLGKWLPLSLQGCRTDLLQVCPNAEVVGLVADHQAYPAIVLERFECLPAHLDDARVDGAGLRVDLEAEHAISEVE